MTLLHHPATAKSHASLGSADDPPRWSAQTHIKVRLHDGGFVLEHCEQVPCLVDPSGVATCGRLACPSCGRGSGNLSSWQLEAIAPGQHVACDCGYMWIPLPHNAESTAAVLVGLASAQNGARP
jgi:hypothetical protein